MVLMLKLIFYIMVIIEVALVIKLKLYGVRREHSDDHDEVLPRYEEVNNDKLLDSGPPRYEKIDKVDNIRSRNDLVK